MNHRLVGGVVPELHQVHHHEVRVEARVSLARRPTKLAPWSLKVVRSEGPEVPGSLFLHHGNTLLRAELEELVVKLPDIIVESDVSTNDLIETSEKFEFYTCQRRQYSRGSGRAKEREVV